MDQQKIIDDICALEWEMFSCVNNAGGKADCQQDPVFFKKMRVCQFENWNAPLLESYRNDLVEARQTGRNLLTEKYAWMMSWTHPEEFARIRPSLPQISQEKRELVEKIVNIQLPWEEEVDRRYPYMRAHGRPLTQDESRSRIASFEVYLSGELLSYSEKTLHAYVDWLNQLLLGGRNMALMVAESTARSYGFPSLAEAEGAAKKAYESKHGASAAFRA